MSKQKLTPRRQPTKKSGKILRAITKRGQSRKKLRAVAAQPAAEFTSEQNSLATKIIGGLFVLLLFHIVAVGAIAMHSKYFQKNGTASEEVNTGPQITNKKEQSARERIAAEDKPAISKNQAYTWVYAGETYQSIAERLNVSVEDLKAINKSRPLKAGSGIKVPTRRIEVVSPAVQAVGNGNQSTVNVVQDDVHVISDGSQNVEVTSKPVKSNYRIHTFKSGDTFWALSTKYNVSVEAIQKANPKTNPTKIRVGDKINIPK